MEISQLRPSDIGKPIQVAYLEKVSEAPRPYRGVTLHITVVLNDGNRYSHSEVLYTGEKSRYRMDAWKRILWIPPEVTDDIMMDDPEFYFMTKYIRWQLQGYFYTDGRHPPTLRVTSSLAVPCDPFHGVEYFVNRWMWWKAVHGKGRHGVAGDDSVQKAIKKVKGALLELEKAVVKPPDPDSKPRGNPPRRATAGEDPRVDPDDLKTVGDYV